LSQTPEKKEKVDSHNFVENASYLHTFTMHEYIQSPHAMCMYMYMLLDQLTTPDSVLVFKLNLTLEKPGATNGTGCTHEI
jgi:hypothetical protein